jgi:DtxR family Mn-dependent transcriptional regulator
METWKEFEQNPITHSAAHHLVAIAELLDTHGYARVSDVAKLLEITRGSASITLKSLKQRNLVTEDENRFLGLSETGLRIANTIQAKRFVMKKLFIDFFKVDPEQAEIDSCKIEHLISGQTAESVTKFLRFLDSDNPSVGKFVNGLAGFDEPCGLDPEVCPCCTHECLAEICGGSN